MWVSCHTCRFHIFVHFNQQEHSFVQCPSHCVGYFRLWIATELLLVLATSLPESVKLNLLGADGLKDTEEALQLLGLRTAS